MKKVFEFLRKSNVWMLMLVMAMALFGITDVSMANAVDGTDDVGKHIQGGDPLNTSIINNTVADLILPDIDQRVTKISPYKNPIDQLSRLVGRKMTAHGWEYKHYSVDIPPISDVVAANLADGTTLTSYLQVSNPDLFNETDTIIAGGVKGYDAAGVLQTSKDLMMYVTGKVVDGGVTKLSVQAINGKAYSNKIVVPAIAKDVEIFLLGNAGMEGDIRSYNNISLPTPQTGYVQKFDLEVGQSTISQMSLKEVDWTLNDELEMGTTKFRAAIERTALKGVKGKITPANKKYPVYTSEGVYWQISKSFELPSSPTEQDLIDFAEYVFTGQSGSNRKILLMGSKFNAAISKIASVQKQLDAKNTEVKWGLTWRIISTNFGDFNALPYDLLNEMGMSNEAIVIDPDYLDKWTLIPLGTKDIDTKTPGTFDGDIKVTTEISSICLRYLNAHCKAKVVVSVPVTGITTSAATKALAVGATYNFAATNTIAPATATNTNVTYISSAPAKATVNASGVVTGVAAGTAVISAITADGSYTVVCTVTVS